MVVFTCVLYRYLIILFGIICTIARSYDELLDAHREKKIYDLLMPSSRVYLEVSSIEDDCSFRYESSSKCEWRNMMVYKTEEYVSKRTDPRF
jgi:hypothetical protein